MKKWLILALLLVAVSAYASSVVFRTLNDPRLCAGCHASEYRSYISPPGNSDLPAHREKNISCLECHSEAGIQSSFEARKLLIKVQLINYSLPAINRILSSNFTLNESVNISDFAILRANCAKCHDIKKISRLKFNHSNASSCAVCHIMHKEKLEKPVESFWRLMGKGGHRNLTCGDCHGTDPLRLEELPQCTKCHVPHLKGAQWDRSTCLNCHSDPHLPLRNATFIDTPTKEMCAACHNDIYSTLEIYNSKHNQNLPACVSCHPKHREARACGDCHKPHGQLHKGSNCNSCHRYVSACTDCHTIPHAPLNGLPSIADGAQWEEFARQTGSKKKG